MNLNRLPAQPAEESWRFTQDLQAPVWTRHPWAEASPGPEQANLAYGVRLSIGFPDPAGRLETAYDDLMQFLGAGGVRLGGAGYTIHTELAASLVGEAFRLEIESGACRILAGDVEGVRRGVFALEDEMLRARGPFLPLGVIARRPFVQRRISRCFFGPIKRPPRMRDELMDDVDYYPPQYLNRLAHEGVNGLWLTVQLRELCSTRFTPEAGQDAPRRLAKLQRTVTACLRYGIRTYVFCIEPRAWDKANPVPANVPELAGTLVGGDAAGGKRYFCPSSATAQQYLYESVHSIFAAVPELGGLINITHGERATTCLSAMSPMGEGRVGCPRCSHRAPWEILWDAVSAMEHGMHDAAPDAELISWLYMPQARGAHRDGPADWVYEVAEHTPPGAVLQFNFESGVKQRVLDRELTGGDYWLSAPGPSSRFERVAESARRSGTPVAAKIQTACSHELATVPYLPVPSLLYAKFAAMRRLGVSHAMLCWYFGNYPGLMNRAAGELSFEPFAEDEGVFLNQLASVYWRAEDVATVVDAWRAFGAGYSLYPLTNLFQYYGPMHDGPVWPLLLKPADAPLAPTWLLASPVTGDPWPPSGDRIGECLLEALTLDQAVALCRDMSDHWSRGVALLRGLSPHYVDEAERLLDIGVAEAIGIQLRTGYNILRFYRQRELMFRMPGVERLSLLDELATIVREELALNARLLNLCEQDSRLGFHSEAEGFKYFPDKIRWRMDQLSSVLADEVPELEQSIRRGALLFPEYTGMRPTGALAHCTRGDVEFWASPGLDLPVGLKWQTCVFGPGAESVRWAAVHDSEALFLLITGGGNTPPVGVLLKIEPRRLWPCKHLLYKPGATTREELPDAVAPQSVEGRTASDAQGWRVVVRVPLQRVFASGEAMHPVRIDVRTEMDDGVTISWRPDHPVPHRLALGADNPADLGWLLFDGDQQVQ